MEHPTTIDDSWMQAMERFEGKTGKRFDKTPKTRMLPKDILELLSSHSKDSSPGAPKWREITKSIEPVCSGLQNMADVAAKATAGMFFGIEACFQALKMLLNVPKQISEWYDDMNNLFCEISQYLPLVDLYKRIEDIHTVDAELVKAIHNVLIKFVDICASSIQYISKPKPSYFKGLAKKIILNDDGGFQRELKEFQNLVQHQSTLQGLVTYKEMTETHQMLGKKLNTIDDNIKEMTDHEELDRMLNWLSPSNPSNHYSDARRRHAEAPKTGSWFLESSDLRQWFAGDVKCVLLHGAIGSGKTVLASTAVSHVEQRLQNDPNRDLSYFFFKTSDHMTVKDLLAYLVRRHCYPENKELQVKRRDAFLDFFRLKYKRRELPDQDELLRYFQSMIGDEQTTFVIIDALDECGATTGGPGLEDIKKMLRGFWHTKNLQFFVSCRDGIVSKDIREVFEDLQRETGLRYSNVSMSKDLINSDIGMLIQQYLGKNIFLKVFKDWPTWREAICERIKPDGMFLLVARQLELLEQRIETIELQDLKSILDELPDDLNGIYGSILDGIPHNQREVSRTILQWLLSARRLLYCSELKEMIRGIFEGPFDVLKTFRSLLTVQNKDSSADQQILWAHDTSIREYLTGDNSGEFHINLVSAHQTIARTCINHLNITMPNGGHEYHQSCTNCPRQRPFLRYAVENWYKHALVIDPREVAGAKMCPDNTLFDKQDESGALARWRQTTIALLDNPIGIGDKFPKLIKIAAVEGFKEITRLLLLHGSPVKSSTQDYDALMAAATESYPTLLAILLEDKNETLPIGNWFSDDQNMASEGSSEEEDLILSICQLLLQFGADISNKNKFGQTALHLASGRHYSEVVRGLIRTDNDIDEKDNSGSTTLHFAAADGSLEVVKVLLSHGSNVNARSTLKSPSGNGSLSDLPSEEDFKNIDRRLLLAAGRNDWKSCRTLIKAGANVRVKDEYGLTPLHKTCDAGAYDIAKLLIDNGADPNAIMPSAQGARTALLSATRSPKATAELLRLLLKAGADPNIGDGLWFRNRSPLHVAANRGMDDMVDVLLSHGADANAHDDHDQIPADLARRNKHEELAAKLDKANSGMSARGGKGETPLHMACASNQYHIAQELLDNGANVQARADDGWTVLHAAARRGSKPLLKLLLSRGALLNANDSFKQTPLHEAAGKGNKAVLKFLLKQPDINQAAVNEIGDTPFMTAVRASRVRLVRIFIENGSVHANGKDWRGHTPLHEASSHQDFEITKLLLERQEVDIDALEYHFRRTPLILAAKEGCIENVRLLLEKGAKAYISDRDGGTPLHEACDRGHFDIVELLLAQPEVDIEARRHRSQRTPLFLAAGNGYVKIVHLLLRYGAKADVKDGSSITPETFARSRDHHDVADILAKRVSSHESTSQS